MGYVDNAYWLDVGTPEAFVRGSCDLVLGRLASPAVPGPPGEGLVLPSARVDASARVTGGTVVGAGSIIGPEAIVEGSVLFDNAIIAAGVHISDSVLGRSAQVGDGVVLDGAVIGDEASVAAGNELRAGLRVWPGVELGPTSIRFSTDA